MSSPRYKVLDTKAVSVPSRQAKPADPAQPVTPSGKPDATAKITAVDVSAEPIVVTAQIDPFDPAASNPLAELHAVALPQGAAQPADPSTLLGGPLPTQGFDVTKEPASTDVRFELAGVNATDQPLAVTILLIGGYAS